MEYTINYFISTPYTATVEAESPEEALKQILENEDWPFENEEEAFVSSAEILDEEGMQLDSVMDYLEQPREMIEQLLSRSANWE